MPSATHQIFEYALLLALGSLVLLDRFAPHELLLTPAQFALHRVAAFALLGALLLLHHWRKELAPAYAVAAMRVVALIASLVAPTAASTSALVAFQDAHRHPWVERLSVAGVLLAGLFAVLFPLPDLSVLYGPYQTIGCRTVRLGGVECRVFYPSATHAVPVPVTKRVHYLHHGKHLAKGIHQFSRVPEWIFSNLENAYLAAVDDAPVATPVNQGGWPLVIFSHGLGGSLELYSFINQQLASAGNIVVVMSHTDGSASVTRPEDDRIEYYQQITDAVRHNIDGEGFRFRNRQLRTRVKEVRSVLDAITALVANDKPAKVPHKALWASVDLNRIHAAGHSFGAATALTATHEDERFGAAVLLDAWMEPVDNEVFTGLGSRAPVLHIGSDPFAVWKENADRITRHANGCVHPLTRVKRIVGSRHNNFSDLPLFSPLINRLVKTAGSIEPKYALRMISQLCAAFLVEQYDTVVTQFPEVVDMITEDPKTK